MSQPRVTIACPRCAHSLQVRVEYVGRKVRCKKCEGEFVIPEFTERACQNCGELTRVPTARSEEKAVCPLCEVARRPDKSRPPLPEKPVVSLGSSSAVFEAVVPTAGASSEPAVPASDPMDDLKRVQAERDQLATERDELAGLLARATTRAETAEAAALHLSKTIQDIQADSQAASQAMESRWAQVQEAEKGWRAERAELVAALDATRQERDAARERLTSLEDSVHSLTMERDQSRSERAELLAALEESRGRLPQLEQVSQTLTTELDEALAQVTRLHEDLAGRQAELEDERAARREEQRLADIDRAELRLSLEAARRAPAPAAEGPPPAALEAALGRIVELEEKLRGHQEVNDELRSHLLGLGIQPSEGF